jgi:peptidoglycan-associated lipoprotein
MNSGAYQPLIRRGGTLVALGVLLSGCAHVKPEELDSRLANLRTEMQGEIAQGDQAVAGDVATLEGRVGDLETRLSNVERELTRLAQEFDATVERLESALRFDMPVYFGFDDSELTGTHREVLDRFASVIREFYPDCLVTAEGFTDAVGTAEYNKVLGQRRADAVKAFLVQEGGLGVDQVRAVSYGEDENRRVTTAHGPGSTGWENRRVALVVDHGGA